jgi:hypothetical protein
MMSDLDKPVWGVPAIAEIINRSTTKTYYLLEKGYVPGRKIGKLWTSTPRELLVTVNGREPVEAT